MRLLGGIIRFQTESESDIIFTDEGQGFHRIATSQITPEYADALRENGLQAFMGPDGCRQPGDLKELMLHEAAVAWLSHVAEAGSCSTRLQWLGCRRGWL